MPKNKSSIKAAIPFFALLGGNGIASQRVNSISLNSSKFAKKPVVYIDNLEANNVSFETVKKTERKSPFAAFTNQSIAKTKNAEIKAQSKALDFLQKNNLLSPTKIKISETSGNIRAKKTLADNWQWATRFNSITNFPPTTSSTTLLKTENCISGATYDGIDLVKFIAMIYLETSPVRTYYCTAYSSYSSTKFFQAKDGAGILSQCQAIHMACDGAALPVELEKFEVE